LKGHLQPAKKITSGYVVDIEVSRAFTSEGHFLEYNLSACGYTQAGEEFGKKGVLGQPSGKFYQDVI